MNQTSAWELLRTHFRGRHQIERDVDGALVFWMPLCGRRQRVGIKRTHCEGDAWVMVASPVARGAQAVLPEALRYMSKLVVGVLTLEGQQLLVRHAEPFETASAERIDELCTHVALGALELGALAQRRPASSLAFLHFTD